MFADAGGGGRLHLVHDRVGVLVQEAVHRLTFFNAGTRTKTRTKINKDKTKNKQKQNIRTK